ncbi:MAG: hypothetical protein LBR80_15340 [Deltaproteobacteria bacterium]|jgi:hypothetical protein|nr:hypothetical protein [Deltaproteobacteria bacterium]
MLVGARNSLAGYMRIGGSVYGSTAGASAADRLGSGLKIANDVKKTLEAGRDEEAVQKKKIAENFETEIARRIAEEDARSEREVSDEGRGALVGSIMGVVERIGLDFGQEMATETMVEVLKGTGQGMNAQTIAVSVGKILRERETLATRILTGKSCEADAGLIRKHFGDVGEDEDFLERVREDSEKLKAVVEFLNLQDDISGVQASSGTVNADATVNPAASGGEVSYSSLSSALNCHFGEAIIKDEDLHRFSDAFEWCRADEVDARNGEYRNAMYGFDFAITVSELGREPLEDLSRFLREELGDEDGAALIANLADSDDVFAAINSLFVANYPGPQNRLAGEIKLNPDGSPLSVSDDESHWIENNRLMEANYARLTDPNYETPQFNYDSDYGYGFLDGRDFKFGDYSWDLGNYLRGSFLDRVNEVIRDDDAVRERFLALAARNFNGQIDSVPDDYGLVGIPSQFNMGQVSTTYLMGVADTTAAERALSELKRFTYPEQHDIFATLPEEFRIVNRTSVKTVELPGYSELATAERIRIYEEAVARYQQVKDQKGLLLEETV